MRRRHQQSRYLLILFILGILIALSIASVAAISFWRSQQPGASASKLAPLPQHPYIQVYFNHNLASSYTDPYRKIKRPGDNLEQIIIDGINQAQSTIDMAIQELRLPNIVTALSDRQKAGVKVRLIIENTYNQGWSEYTPEQRAKFTTRDTDKYSDFVKFADLNGDRKLSQDEIDQRDTIPMLKKFQIAWVDDTSDGSKGSGLMHHKFTIIDGKTVLLGSANYTLSDMHGDFDNPGTQGNSNNLVKISNKAVAELFTQEFNLMWGDGPGWKPDGLFGVKKPHRTVQYVVVGDAQVRVKFSPDSKQVNWTQTSNGVIGTAISGAKKTIDTATFVFAEPTLGNLLDKEHERGIQVRTLIDPGFAYRNYSVALDMWGYVTAQDCIFGNSRPWATPIKTAGIPSLPHGDLLHHKFGVIDQNTVVTGSHNWSNAANYTNDETLIAILNPIVAAHFQREFDRLFDDAILGPPAKVIKKAKTTCPPDAKRPNKQLDLPPE